MGVSRSASTVSLYISKQLARLMYQYTLVLEKVTQAPISILLHSCKYSQQIQNKRKQTFLESATFGDIGL